MQIAQILGNFSLGGADLLRRAMGKKKPEEMEKQRAIFMQGALNNQVEESVATYIFDLMEKFAGYGFNKTIEENALIYVNNSLKAIKNCQIGDRVISRTVSGEYVQSQVVALHDHGKVPLWEIEFDDHTIERCTLDHKC
jgi:DNA polymerase-3 subunit alpha